MADETIKIEVDDAEIDAAIAKLDEALGKKEQVKAEAGIETPEETRAELEDLQTKADEVKESAEEAKAAVDEVVEEDEKHDLKGKSMLMRRMTAQLPGIREGYRLTVMTNRLMAMNPYIALLIVAFMAGQALWSWLEDQKKAAEEYRKMVMEYRGFTTRAQFDAWMEEDRRRTQETYRGAVIS